jgi:ABC-type iron transport system FetAB ATPase subunit
MFSIFASEDTFEADRAVAKMLHRFVEEKARAVTWPVPPSEHPVMSTEWRARV